MHRLYRNRWELKGCGYGSPKPLVFLTSNLAIVLEHRVVKVCPVGAQLQIVAGQEDSCALKVHARLVVVRH